MSREPSAEKTQSFFFFQAEDGIRDVAVTGVQTCALPICGRRAAEGARRNSREREGGLRRDCQGWRLAMSKFFINRPIVAIVISILTVIVGAITIVSLPVSLFPAIAPPEVQVQTTYVGADAQTVEQSVATPIEQQMSGVDNLNYMYSVNSSTGEMRLILDFDVKTEPNTDLILTQLRQSQAASQLPAEVTNFGVTVQKTLTAPLMLISLYSPSGVYGSQFLANYAYINLNDQLTRVPGI